MKSALYVALVCMVLAIGACGPRQTDDQKFESLAKNYIEKLLEMKPEWATGLGDHRYDGRMSDYSMAGIEQDRQFNKRYLDSLGTVNVSKLSPTNRIDYDIMKTNLQSWLFSIDTVKEYEWNPLSYNIGNAIYGLLARDFAPLKDRLMSVKSRLEEVPRVIDAAKANLKNPPKTHTETAILQNKGNVGMVRSELNSFLDQVPEMKTEFASVQETAAKAFEEYGTWLEKDLLPRSNADFRIGDEKFRRKLYYSLESDLTKEEILRNAEEDLRKTQDAMYETALPLYKKFYPKMTGAKQLENRKAVIKGVLDKLAEKHPTNETIVDLAKQYMNTTTDFVRLHNIVTVPGEPIKVIVMPEFQRGVAVAYCDAAGPLEKNGETFYAISPTPSDWTKQRVESFFREYNNYMLQNLTIHEAMPGHYLQLAHSNKFKAPTMVRAIFSSGTFIEGWATYAEQVMVEKGYGGPEVKMQQLKMRLRLIINSIIDQKIHTGGMTEKEAIGLMMNEGFQEEGEAAGKWRRACLTSTQLSTYYVGNVELNRIRNGYMAKNPMADMKTMHDAMLSLGSPAPKYVMEALGLMQQESKPMASVH
jgi:uncharacterized protein (DUF885 family)